MDSDRALIRYVLVLGACILTVYVLMQLKFLLVPLVFASLLFMILLPLRRYWVRFFHSRILGVAMTMLTVSIPLIIFVLFFFWQTVDVMQNLSGIGLALEEGVNQVVLTLGQWVNMERFNLEVWIQDNLSTIIQQPISWLAESTEIFGSFLLTFIFLVFMLLYRRGIERGVHMTFGDTDSKWLNIIEEIKKMTERYLVGIFSVVVILAVLNSIGLSLIGLDYAVFWGILAGFLALIPYLGTTLGGALPLLYSIASTGGWVQPVMVVILFSIIQFSEGNFITPKIVGNQVSLNPLTAIIALVLGVFIWGLAGAVLAIPLAGVFRIICTHFEMLQPLAFMMGTELSSTRDFKWKDFDED